MTASFSVNTWIFPSKCYSAIVKGSRVFRELNIMIEDATYEASENFQENLSATNRENSSIESLSKPLLGEFVNNKYSRVVLVDDDALTNMLNKKIIQSIHPTIPISTFIEVDEALKFLKEADQLGDILIFLDINFPIKNGWDFLEEYKLFKTYSTVIMLSSSIDQQERNKSKKYSQVIDYVSKPLSFEYVTKVLFQS